jgi:hypothetical protein
MMRLPGKVAQHEVCRFLLSLRAVFAFRRSETVGDRDLKMTEDKQMIRSTENAC